MSAPIYVPLCIDCVHIDLSKKVDGIPVCKAYPNGIPYEVWKEKSKPNYDENTPCPNGYKFEHDKPAQQ